MIDFLALEITLLMHLHKAENQGASLRAKFILYREILLKRKRKEVNLLIISGLPPLESSYNLKQNKGRNPSTRVLKE